MDAGIVIASSLKVMGITARLPGIRKKLYVYFTTVEREGRSHRARAVGNDREKASDVI